jgi:hypothetical protein
VERAKPHSTSVAYNYAIVHMLDDLEGVVDVRGFDEVFHESIARLMVVDYLENSMVSTFVKAVGASKKPSPTNEFTCSLRVPTL